MTRRKAIAFKTATRLTRAAWLLALVALLDPAEARLSYSGSGPGKEAVRFAVIGDSGTGKAAQWQVARAMEDLHAREPFEFVLMLGDNIYGGAKGPSSFKKRFEAPYANLLKKGVAFYAALGNHGSSWRERHYANFNMKGRPYYTFTKGEGLVQFFALDSNRMNRGQLQWLEKELSVSKSKWKVAFFHHPVYSSARSHGSDLKLRRLLEPLFVKFGVNVALSGHDHVYERLKPQQGVTYFVSGAAGKLRKGNLDRSDPLMAAGNDEVCHFMVFEVTDETLRFKAVGSDGQVLDQGAVQNEPLISR